MKNNNAWLLYQPSQGDAHGSRSDEKVRVVVRVRPLSQKETKDGHANTVKVFFLILYNFK